MEKDNCHGRRPGHRSVPSPKAEPFKLWLARVGAERIEETIDPKMAIKSIQMKAFHLILLPRFFMLPPACRFG